VDGDRTLQLIQQGYLWGARLRDGAVAVPTRLAGRRAAVLGGPDGVRRFYDPRLQRRGAFPPPVKLVLFGPGTVHGLDDEEHHARKAMFLEVLTAPAIAELTRIAEHEWATAIRQWPQADLVVLFDEAVRILGTSALTWAGVPEQEDLERRSHQMATVVDGFGKPGLAYARAVSARVQLALWTQDLIRRSRQGQITPPADSALHAAATAKDRHGRLLPAQVAATELLNLVRPTVAVAWFVTFAGLALHEHPDWRERIAGGDEQALLAFCQEVRRHYPFTPWLAALARTAQDVQGVRVGRWGLVVLDVYGTLHDPNFWSEPDRFRPDRFLGHDVDPNLLVPQGGGEVATGHRCPGEDVVLAMLRVAVRALAGLPHTLPDQDLSYDLTQILTRPRSGVRIQAGTHQLHQPEPAASG
jgi:fatty-acid peroxygenase